MFSRIAMREDVSSTMESNVQFMRIDLRVAGYTLSYLTKILGKPVKDFLCPYRNEFNISLKSKKYLSEVYGKLMSEKQPSVKKVGKKLPSSDSH